MIEHRNYAVIDPATLEPDPANYARTHDLVGKHGETARTSVGAWRWPLLHADRVANLLDDWISGADRIIDYGGAAGPLGYGSLVVDRIADVRGLEEVDGQCDLIFTAHTLEHVVDLGLVLCSFHWKLPAGGRVIALVPSWRKEMLRAENWAYHAQTFCLSVDPDAPDEYTRLDLMFNRHGFDIHFAAEGYENIIVFAVKR